MWLHPDGSVRTSRPPADAAAQPDEVPAGGAGWAGLVVLTVLAAVLAGLLAGASMSPFAAVTVGLGACAISGLVAPLATGDGSRPWLPLTCAIAVLVAVGIGLSGLLGGSLTGGALLEQQRGRTGALAVALTLIAGVGAFRAVGGVRPSVVACGVACVVAFCAGITFPALAGELRSAAPQPAATSGSQERLVDLERRFDELGDQVDAHGRRIRTLRRAIQAGR